MAQENLKPLKTLVFSMGLVLMGGMVLLLGLVWKKTTQPSGNAAISSECAGGNVSLTGRGALVDTVLDGATLRVILEKKETQREIVTIDLCTGKEISAVTVQSDAVLIEQ